MSHNNEYCGIQKRIYKKLKHLQWANNSLTIGMVYYSKFFSSNNKKHQGFKQHSEK